MKKFITLLLVLTGMVCTASADTYTVYFKPNSSWSSAGGETFKIRLWGDGDVKNVNLANSNGIYSAEFPSDYNATGWQFVRCSSDGEPWNYSPDITAIPSSDVYYTMSGNPTGDDAWNYFTFDCTTPSDKTFYIANDGCEADILPNFMDDNSEAGTNLVSNGDFTYSRTITGNVLRAGSYAFKLYDESNNWYSDTDNSYAAWPVSGISTTDDGEYNIVYSFNYLTGEASATATNTGASVSLSTKYVITGDEKLVGKGWDVSGNYNVMNIDEGGETATLTITNVSLPQATYYYKAVKLLCNNGTAYHEYWESGENSNYYFNSTGLYDITFSCNLSTLESSASATNVTGTGYFIYGGTDSWTLGQKMTENEGVYSATFSNMPGYAFCIVHTDNLGATEPSDWSQVFRPSKDENERTYLSFKNLSDKGIIQENSNRGWEIQSGGNYANDGDVT